MTMSTFLQCLQQYTSVRHGPERTFQKFIVYFLATCGRDFVLVRDGGAACGSYMKLR